jgi:hypothetical protein
VNACSASQAASTGRGWSSAGPTPTSNRPELRRGWACSHPDDHRPAGERATLSKWLSIDGIATKLRNTRRAPYSRGAMRWRNARLHHGEHADRARQRFAAVGTSPASCSLHESACDYSLRQPLMAAAASASAVPLVGLTKSAGSATNRCRLGLEAPAISRQWRPAAAYPLELGGGSTPQSRVVTPRR